MAGAQPDEAIQARDKILFNARIFTANKQEPFAEAIGISGKTVVAVGSLEDVKKKMTPNPVLIDMRGGCLIPGFVDSHNHAIQGGEVLLGANVDDSLLSIPELDSFAKASIRSGRGMHGKYLVIYGLNIATWSRIAELQSDFNGKDYAQQPIMLRGSDGHTGWVNKALLDEAGINLAFVQSLPAEKKKFFGTSQSGESNGFVSEDGLDQFSTLIPPVVLDPMDIGLSAFHYNNAMGITAWLDPAAGSTSDKGPNKTLDAYSLIAEQNLMSAHVAATLIADANGDASKQIKKLKSIQRQYRSIENLSVIGFKVFADGVLEFPTQTAALSEPYANSQSLGVLMVDPRKFNQFMILADKNDVLVHVHAIGDKAVTTALNGFAAARQSNGDSQIPHTITHIQIVKPTDFGRFKTLGALASVQLLWALGDVTTIDLVKPYIAPDLYKYQYPARSLLDAGAILCGGSDWPVSTANPFEAIYEAETREGKMGVLDSTQRVPRMAMFYAYTINAAKALRMENKIGSLEPGKSADLILVDRDVFSVSPFVCKDTKVIWTLFEGRLAYHAGN